MIKDPDLIFDMKESSTSSVNKKEIVENSKKATETVRSPSSNRKSKRQENSHKNQQERSMAASLETSTPPSPSSSSPLSSSSSSPQETNVPPPLVLSSIVVSSGTNTSCSDLQKYNLISDKISVLKCNNQIKELHTLLRDRETSHSDFKFYSDRLIRLLVEESLNQLPYSSQKVITPANCEYDGIKYIKGVCGVSIMRSGEAMEKGLRECCRSIRIGKILIQSTDDEQKKKSCVVYAKFPSDIISRKILLMYPITTSGSTVNLAIKTLKEHGVAENNILVLCLFSTPSGLQSVSSQYPDVHILTSEIHPIVPTDFGQRYFGTE